jgi:phosphoribosylformimino-5-aminoimidazole carboxamide ribotide isomerase
VILYPAIDIRDGKCVRLIEGDFSRETVFEENPSHAARRWVEAGANWLHVVDLDGAREGKPMNHSAVAAIRDAVDVPIQLGGGMRSMDDIATAFAYGVNRVILGTAVLRNPEVVDEAVRTWNGTIAIGLDARNGLLATDAWLGQSDVSAVETARSLTEKGVQHFIYTDIHRDGRLSGPNLAALSELVASTSAEIIASGGVSSLQDLVAIRATGARGAIIGRAIYDGRIDLATAFAVFDLTGVEA